MRQGLLQAVSRTGDSRVAAGKLVDTTGSFLSGTSATGEQKDEIQVAQGQAPDSTSEKAE